MDKKVQLEKLQEKMITEIQEFAIILLDVDGTILSWNVGGAENKRVHGEGNHFTKLWHILYVARPVSRFARTIN